MTTFKWNANLILQEGNLAWEYNPFRNYRNENKELVDFETEELNFDLEHPVDIIPQYSYDGSVNLLLNDGKNTPKLINSRFSPTGRMKYKIVNRLGEDDTNIYDKGGQFNSDASLYKKTLSIPNLEFIGTYYGGQLPIGNYHFYFKLMDADGNTTDFIAESGLVSLFIGTTPKGIRSGFVNENSNKLVSFYLSNLDLAYPYLEVYYSRSTSAIRENTYTEAKRIDKKFIVNQGTCNIIINGFEDTETIPLNNLNLLYNLVNSAKCQAVCLNRLFLGNIEKSKIDYLNLADLALRFTPKAYYTDYNPGIDERYNVSNLNQSYYNSKFIYDFVGYWPDEYYRLGVVFIINNELTSVFNIMGKLNLTTDSTYIYRHVSNDNNSRNYIQINGIHPIDTNDENTKGIISIKDNGVNNILGITITIPDDVKSELEKLGVQGYFFVRQQRIPITMCQALTIATDSLSHTPVLRAKEGTLAYNDKFNSNDEYYITERFIDDDKKLSTSFVDRLLQVNNVNVNAAICPEYDVNTAYLNSFFTGDELIIQESNTLPKYSYLSSTGRHFYNKEYSASTSNLLIKLKIIGIQDSMTLVALGDNSMFSAKAGDATDGSKFSFVEEEIKKTEASNMIRGNYGSFIGFSSTLNDNRIINIKTLDADNNLEILLEIRSQDDSPYMAISDRLSIQKSIPTLYRGDCYICLFTHRINRNFNSSAAPYNDIIVDPKTFQNLEYDNETLNFEKASKINIGDLNAVLLGMWVTFMLRSTINLNIRSIDETYIEESLKAGHPRGFYPLQSMSTAGNYKLPEAACYNAGFKKSLSDKLNYVLKESPYIKDEFSNRIVYSDVNITDSYQSGFRIFKSTNYKDYPKTYGSITKLIEWFGNILCVFEHGIGLIPVNERAVAGQGDGGYAFINTSNVLPDNPKIISDTYGSLWADSIIKTSKYIYGVDTVARKLWRTDGNSIECISDFKVQEFLNKNISLGERELTPNIGVRNVKTFFNAYKLDILFTFYDDSIAWNLCFNELLNLFTTFYSWIPSLMENIDNIPFSFDRTTSKLINQSNSNSKVKADKYLIYPGDIITLSSEEEFEIIESGVFANADEEGTNKLYCTKDILINNGDISAGDFYLKEGPRKYTHIKDEVKKLNIGKLPDNLYVKQENSSKYEKVNSLKFEEDFESTITVKVGTTSETIHIYSKALPTDFWKHGLAGIIDIQGNIKPTNWYGKQHPFEFEFIVVDDPSIHKIFTNLELIANKAVPESFSYEIIGECYDFNKNKKNMYYIQEALKHLWQTKGHDIVYDSNYVNLEPKVVDGLVTDLPKTDYSRRDSVTEVEDYYHLMENSKNQLRGGEIKYYPNRQEYRIVQNTKAVPLDEDNIFQANCDYLEDKWNILINPLLVSYKNDSEIKLPIKNSVIAGKEINYSKFEFENIPIDYKRWSYLEELDLKDKFIKIKVRYSGQDLAIIDFINTIYKISYS